MSFDLCCLFIVGMPQAYFPNQRIPGIYYTSFAHPSFSVKLSPRIQNETAPF
jgi:hypothetical protein